jgi:hypothetical protein
VTDAELMQICTLPTLRLETGSSWLELLEQAREVVDLTALTEADLAEYLRRHPELIKPWLDYSEDKRTSGHYLVRSGSGYQLGTVDAGGDFGPTEILQDQSLACARFIVRELRRVLPQHNGEPVEALRRDLLARSFPRVRMTLLISLAGLGAFYVSVALLHFGLTSMAMRYALAAAAGYAFFLGLVRSWVRWESARLRDLGDLPIDLAPDDIPSSPSFSGHGGSFGGGGASASFGEGSGSSVPHALDVGIDLDEAALVLIGVVALFAGVAALGWVVWWSPTLLAEALLDAAAVSVLYRRVRARPRRHWLHGVVRRTWWPALLVCIFAAVAGLAFQGLAPQQHSLGAVLHAWWNQGANLR